MVRYELLKIVKSKFIWFLLLIGIIVNIYNIYHLHSQENKEIRGHDRIYREVQGELTDEKIKFTVQNYNRLCSLVNSGEYDTKEDLEHTYTGYTYGDMSEFEYFFNRLKYVYEYKDNLRTICNLARMNVTFYSSLGNTYEGRLNEKIVDTYKDRILTKFYDQNNTQKYLEYEYSSIFVLLLLLVGIPGLIYYEKQTKMSFLLESSEKGLARCIDVKIVASAIYCFAIVLLFEIVDFLSFQYIYGLDGLEQPIFSIEQMKYSIWTCSIYRYMLYDFAMKYCGYLLIAISLLLFSVLFRDSVKALSIGIALIALEIGLCLYTTVWFNPILLLINIKLIKRFTCINVLGYPVFSYKVVVVSVLVGFVSMCIMIRLIVKRRRTLLLQ